MTRESKLLIALTMFALIQQVAVGQKEQRRCPLPTHQASQHLTLVQAFPTNHNWKKSILN